MFEIVAHRGASFDAPENTLAAIELAWEQQADAVEIDVHLSRDAAILVFHDENTQRICGVDRPVGDQSLAELQSLDAGAWKGPRWSGEKIPGLRDVLATLRGDRRLFIEIKCGPEIIPALDATFREMARPWRQNVLIGFDIATMHAAKKAFPHAEVHGLVDLQATSPTPTAADCLRPSKQAGLDGVGLSLSGAVDRAFVEYIHAAGLKVGVWTVDDPGAARRLMEARVDSLTTNRPGWLREALGC